MGPIFYRMLNLVPKNQVKSPTPGVSASQFQNDEGPPHQYLLYHPIRGSHILSVCHWRNTNVCKNTNLGISNLLNNADLFQNQSLMELHERYLTTGGSVVLCVQRENAVKHLVDLMGPEDPRRARVLSQFNWTAIFGTDPVANGLHGNLVCQL